MVELPIVKKHLGPLLERHRRSLDIFRERADSRDGVIYFDVSDLDLEGYNKFIPYFLFPDALYSVGVSASPTRAKVSVGTNPWKESSAEVNLASLPKNMAAAVTRASPPFRSGRATWSMPGRWRKKSPPPCAIEAHLRPPT